MLIEQKGNQFFSAIFGDNKVNYSVRAVAAVYTDDRYCALALNPTSRGALTVNGSSSVDFSECRVGVNSNHSDAMILGTVASLTAECIDVVGGIKSLGTATLTCDAAETGVDPIEDPFDNLTAPDLATKYPTCSSYTSVGPVITSLAPGRYCDNLTFGSIASFTGSGVYVLDGVNLSFGTGASVVTGVGITIILMNGATISGLNGTSQAILTAPTAGPYAGVLIFSDPATQTAGAKTTINGGLVSVLDGLLYFPNQELQFTGNALTVDGCTMLVAEEIKFAGSSEMDISGCKSRYGLEAPTGVYTLAQLVE